MMAVLLATVFMHFLTLSLSAPIPVEILDLTYVFDNNTLHWPEVKKFESAIVYNGTKDGYWLQLEEFSSSTHVGTHMDAPCHFARGRWCIDEIPVERLVAPAAVIDITKKAEEDRDALVSVADLRAWERQFRASLDGSLVVIRSGWGSRWGDRLAYTGTRQLNASALHFPGISREAATFLANNRSIVGVAVETLSLDHGPSRDFMAHRILFDKNIYGLENVASLDKLPLIGATIHAMPMKIGKGSGASTRIIATFPKIVFRKDSNSTEKGLREIIIFHK